MSWSRRTFLTSTAAASLAACTFNTARGPSRATADVAVRTLIGQGDKRALPAAGFVIMKQGEVIASAVAGDAAGLDPTEGVQRRPFRIDTPFRAASISKMATALTALRLSNAGLIDLDADIRNYTDLPLLNPAFPDTPITMRQLLAHTSTIQDPEEYWVAAPGDIRSILGPDMFRRTGFDGAPLAYGPGEWLEYANINYGIAANVMEQVTAERFDLLARDRVILPLRLEAGFNWTGVWQANRRRGATLYRKVNGSFAVQSDGPEILAGTRPSSLAPDDYNFATYDPGTNGTLFGPHGGLRISLIDLAHLAGAVGRAPELTDEVWRLNPAKSNGYHEEDVFQSFGTGVFRHEPDVSAWPGQLMLGHHGQAYGLYAGAFHLPGKGVELAYAVTGTPEGAQAGGGRHTAFNVWEQTLVNIARATVG